MDVVSEDGKRPEGKPTSQEQEYDIVLFYSEGSQKKMCSVIYYAAVPVIFPVAILRLGHGVTQILKFWCGCLVQH